MRMGPNVSDVSFGHRCVYFYYILTLLINVLLHKAGDDENGQARRPSKPSTRVHPPSLSPHTTTTMTRQQTQHAFTTISMRPTALGTTMTTFNSSKSKNSSLRGLTQRRIPRHKYTSRGLCISGLCFVFLYYCTITLTIFTVS